MCKATFLCFPILVCCCKSSCETALREVISLTLSPLLSPSAHLNEIENSGEPRSRAVREGRGSTIKWFLDKHGPDYRPLRCQGREKRFCLDLQYPIAVLQMSPLVL